MLVPLVLSVLATNSSTDDQASGDWDSTLLPEISNTSILPLETSMTMTRVIVNSSMSSLPTTTSLTTVLTTPIPPIVDVILTETTLSTPVKITPVFSVTPGSYSSEPDQSNVIQDGSFQLRPKSQDSQLWSDHDVVTLLDAALASFAAIQPAWIPVIVTLLTGKCFIFVTMHSFCRF